MLMAIWIKIITIKKDKSNEMEPILSGGTNLLKNFKGGSVKEYMNSTKTSMKPEGLQDRANICT